jgi:hypothetical protein
MSEVVNNTEKKKRRGRPPKNEKPKAEQTQNDVSKLLKSVDDILPTSINSSNKIKETKQDKPNVIDDASKNKGVEWLQEQLDVLTEDNEKLTKERDEAVENYRKLFASVSDKKPKDEFVESDLKTIKDGVVTFYKELAVNYEKHMRAGWKDVDVKVSHVLKRMRMYFPFLK